MVCKKKWKFFISALILILIITGLIIFARDKIMNNIKKPLEISVMLGDNITDVKSRSSYPIEIINYGEAIDGISAANEDLPVILKYRDPKYGFILPSTILVNISSTDKIIDEIATNPQLELLNLSDSIQLIKKLAITFENAGWQPLPTNLYRRVELEDLEEKFKNDVPYAEYKIYIWKNGRQEIVLSIKRELTAQQQESVAHKPVLFDSKKFEDLYLINLCIQMTPEN